MLKRPFLLLRHAHADKQDIRFQPINLGDNIFFLKGRKIPVVKTRDVYGRKFCFQFFNNPVDDLFAAPQKVCLYLLRCQAVEYLLGKIQDVHSFRHPPAQKS